ncbi:alpha/beta hydrolase [Psychroserpens jangbogonensis]|uniref:alpha/beta hydrolase n=1 Tax=Psychroserpens jangbogonensis TaxID=1484460 RepID=UPI000691A479|nr:alpha/beta fold hydrolase [Psychroserpens jangbogonensis]
MMKYLFFSLALLSTTLLFSQEIIKNLRAKEVLVMNDSIKLPGTLTYNPYLNKQPLVIFVPGSGNPDRNGNQPQFGVNGNYIKSLSYALAIKDIAFFRFDKRNVTPSNIKHILKSYEFNDLVNDIKAVINTFKNNKTFSSITLIGHSQGSLVSMMAADENINKFISLAGLGESVDITIVKQLNAQSPDLAKIAEQHIEELNSTGTIKEVNPMLVGLFAKQNHQFLISYLPLDPNEEIKKLNIPILIINGSKDLQVKVEDAHNLHNANPKSELVIIDKMNHVLKIIEKDEDNLASYMTPDFMLSEELVEVIETFIKK